MNFRVAGLSPDSFAPLFELTDADLAARGAKRLIADEPNAFPCRVSLRDASPGDEVLLVPFRHHDGPSPYQASGPIYVRRGVARAVCSVNALPAMQVRRLTSLRAYDASGFLVEADVVPGVELEPLVRKFLENPDVAWMHAHNARPGCFAFKIERAAD